MDINLAKIDFCPGQGGGSVLQEKTTEILLTETSKIVTPDSGYDGMSKVTVTHAPVETSTSVSISTNGSHTITPGEGYDATMQVIATVNVPEQKEEETFNVTPSTVSQTITPTSGKVFSSGTVGAVTSSIDSNIQAGNIKKDVQILGVTGTLEEGITPTGTLSISNNGTYDVTNYASANVNVPQSVEGYTMRQALEGSIYSSNLYDPSCSFIRAYMFYNDYFKINTVNLPSCKKISDAAFYNNYNLSSVNLPICYLIDREAFKYCTSLKDISIPNCETIYASVFYSNRQLTTISIPKCSYIGQDVFYNCVNLSNVYLTGSSFVTLQGNAFSNTHSYLSIYVNYSLYSSYLNAQYWSNIYSKIYPYLPELSLSENTLIGSTLSIDSGYVTSLGINPSDVHSTYLPYLTTIGSSTFKDHSNLSGISMLNVTTYGDYAFDNCTLLSEITVGTSNAQAGSSIFNGCTNLNKINVPYLHYDYYISAENWSQYSSYISPLLPELSFDNGLLYGSISGLGDKNNWSKTGATVDNLRSIFLPNCKYIGNSSHLSWYPSGTFKGCRNLTTVDLPECSTIGVDAFANDSSLTSLSLPNCAYVDGVALGSTAIVSLELPRCAFISGAAFILCSSLTTLSIPICSNFSNWYGNAAIREAVNFSQLYIATNCYLSYIHYSHYNDCIYMTKLNSGIGSIYTHWQNYSLFVNANGWSSLSSLFVSVGEPGTYMLSYSDGLLYGDTSVMYNNIPYTQASITSVSLPNVYSVYSYTFSGCTSLTSITLPECEYIGNNTFAGCGRLTMISLPKCKELGANFTMNCLLNPKLYLNNSSVCRLLSAGAGTVLGSIYVPASLVDAYKSATNWTYYSSQIFAIPE